jgi:hypothetical protein
MRKHVLGPVPPPSDSQDGREWLKLQEMAEVEVTSEADGYPIESAFTFGAGPGWRAASRGKQRIRFVFDHPQSIKRIHLQFNEPAVVRTQEFTVQWSGGSSDHLKEVVRQQWNFSPPWFPDRVRRLSSRSQGSFDSGINHRPLSRRR